MNRTRRGHRWIVSGVILAQLGLWAPTLDAQSVAPAERRLVDVSIVATAESTAPMQRVLEDLLGWLGVRLTTTSTTDLDLQAVVTPAPVSGRVARVWIDLRQPDRATVFIADATWERILIRHVLREGNADEIQREAIGHIVAAAIEALLAGGRIGVDRARIRESLGLQAPRVAAEPRAPAVPAAASDLPRAWADIGAGGSVSPYGTPLTFAAGPIVTIAAGARTRRFSAGAAVLLDYAVPIVVETADAGLRVQPRGARFLGVGGYEVARGIELRATVGGGVEIVDAAAYPTRNGSFQAEPPRTIALGVFRADGQVRFVLREHLALLLGLGVEVELARVRYVAEIGGQFESLLAPWPVRPVLTVAIVASM